MAWANERHFVLITNDLDLSAMLAASAGAGPSVVQVRMQDLLSDSGVRSVANAVADQRRTGLLSERRLQQSIERRSSKVLLSIDEGGTRVRMLPLRGPRETS